MKHIIVLLATMLISAAAIAGSCPRLMSEIDNRLAAGPMLDAEIVEEVIILRTQGEAAHQQGDHDQAMAALEEALEILDEADAG